MKKIERLKLNQLSKTELERRELNNLKGGTNCCICGCQGPSGSVDNSNANIAGNKYSPDGGGAYGQFA